MLTPWLDVRCEAAGTQVSDQARPGRARAVRRWLLLLTFNICANKLLRETSSTGLLVVVRRSRTTGNYFFSSASMVVEMDYTLNLWPLAAAPLVLQRESDARYWLARCCLTAWHCEAKQHRPRRTTSGFFQVPGSLCRARRYTITGKTVGPVLVVCCFKYQTRSTSTTCAFVLYTTVT